MNLEMFEKRLQEIEKHMKQTMANYNLLEGGRQECLYWMDILKKESEVPIITE